MATLGDEEATASPVAVAGEPRDEPPDVTSTEEPVAVAREGAFSAFQSRAFTLFWATISLSLTGVWVRITAQSWLVYDLTGDEALLGVIAFCQAAPVLVASPIAGALLDRVDRRRVLLGVQVVVAASMLVLAVLVATGAVEVWHIMAVAVVAGAASGFDWPARLSLVPSLVSPARLQSAVALNAAAFNGSRILGPAIAGFLIYWLGSAACFFLTAAMYLPFVLVLATLRIPRPTAPLAGGTEGSAFAGLLDGYRYIWRTPVIRGLLSVDIVPLMFGIAYFTLAPAVARDVLGLGERGYGVLLTANGAGSLLGTVVVAAMGGVRRRGRIVVTGVACFAVALIAFALSGNVVLSFVLILLLGLVVAVYGTLNDTLVQTNVDEAYRGRVLSVYSMFWGLTPIGGLEAGFLANHVGVQAALALNGFLVLAYVPFLLRFTPVRQVD